MIVLDYDWRRSFDYLVDEEAYISAFFHTAHREMKNLAKSLEDTVDPNKEEDDQEFEPDTSWAEDLLDKTEKEVEQESYYDSMTYTPMSGQRHIESLPEARASAEFKYLWEKLAHDLDFYSVENYEKLLSEEILTHLKDEIVENHSELI